ncbi:MAG: ABC-type phosphate transport system substrate-binding protein [Sphingomonas bacterium]|jgi:phosphate transport system substrate-binding protein|nr:ABC-type phosphate transport system substrate-binding protein [Sphingomonas bacterium]
MFHLPFAGSTRSLLLGGAAFAFAGPALAAQDHVLLTVPAGVTAPANLAATLSKWRQSGEVADVLWLDANQRADPAFNTFVVLDFPDEAGYKAWAAKDAPTLQAPVEIHHVEAQTHGETYPRDSNHSIFQVDTFEATHAAAGIDDYARHYVKPLMEGQRLDKVVLRYTLYEEQRGKAGPDKAWLLTEYRDPAAFARAPQEAQAITQKLDQQDAGFAHLDQTKATLRTPGVVTVSRYAELPPPQLPDLDSYKPQVHLTGTLRIYGTDLKNAVEYLARGFQQYQPDLKVSWNTSTSSEGAIAGLYTGVSDIAPMGDDAKLTDEMPFFNVNGYLPTEISVATGGYEKRGSLWAWAIVVNKDNPLNSISIDELEHIFGAERSGGWTMQHNDWRYSAEFAVSKSANLRTWGQIGVKGALANKEIQTYGFSAPGFQAAFERHWFHWSHKWNPNLLEYVEHKEAVDGPDGDAVSTERPLEILARDKTGMGIAGLLHIKNQPGLKVLAISEHKGGPAIPLTPATVANRSYPLHRDAYFYINKAPGQPLDPMVREFMRFVLSREGQEILTKVNYYYPLDRAYLREQLKKLDN